MLNSPLRTRLPHIALTTLLLIALAPTSIHQPTVSALNAALASLQSNMPGSAHQQLSEALRFEPSLEPLHILASELALAAGEPQSALDHLSVFQNDSIWQDKVFCLTQSALLDLGEVEKVLTDWIALRQTCSRWATFLEVLATNTLQLGKVVETSSILNFLLSQGVEKPALVLDLGLIQAATNPDLSLSVLRRYQEITTGENALSLALIRTIEDARLEEDPAYSLAQVGQTLAAYGEWGLATVAFQGALSVEPGYIEARAYYGLSLDRTGKDGLSEILKAVEAAPSAALPRLILGYHWQSKGDFEKAFRELEIAASIDPDNPVIAAELGATYSALGNIPAAEIAYRKAAELTQDDPDFWLLLAEHSLRTASEVESLGLPAARNAVVIAPEDPAALDALGYAHLLLENTDLADRLISASIQLDPTRPATQFHLGLLRLSQGYVDRARAAFELTLQLDPEGLYAALSERMLDT